MASPLIISPAVAAAPSGRKVCLEGCSIEGEGMLGEDYPICLQHHPFTHHTLELDYCLTQGLAGSRVVTVVPQERHKLGS